LPPRGLNKVNVYPIRLPAPSSWGGGWKEGTRGGMKGSGKTAVKKRKNRTKIKKKQKQVTVGGKIKLLYR
jgi:hypothetical protein